MDDHGHTQRCEFSVLDRKHPFWANLAQKIKIASLSFWYAEQFAYAEFYGDVHFFCFRPEIPFLGNIGQKNQNCQPEFKFGTCANLNMQNSIMVLAFCIFDRKYLF